MSLPLPPFLQGTPDEAPRGSLILQRLGRGLAFPLGPDARGRMARNGGLERVRQSIFMILETEPGERVMRPDFGAGLRAFLHQPNTPATRAGIQRAVSAALERYEPRIRLDAVRVEPDAEVRSAVWIEIDYRIRLDGSPDNLVFPFHLE